MKRQKRNPEKFEVIDLYAALARDNNYQLAVDEDVESFIGKIRDSLKASFNNDSLLHGRRVESLFPYVAGALGRCCMIKQEDSGNQFSDGLEIQSPDYVVILKDGQRFFVEVKNCSRSDPKYLYPLKKDYVERLENYAKLHGAILKFAIYFSKFNKWVLISKEYLTEQKNRYVTSFLYAMAINEMAVLGDRMIGSKPFTMVLVADQNKPAFIDDNSQAQFIISDIKFYCDGLEIVDSEEKRIAFYLIRFGSFTESKAVALYDGDQLFGVKIDYNHERPAENQSFNIIGELSSMVSRSHSEHIIKDGKLIYLDTQVDPEIFSVVIPVNYKSDRFPIYQMTLQPNPEFKVHD
ncbi:hypothetical protein ACI2KR_27120 [Pseudomonas luteola]